MAVIFENSEAEIVDKNFIEILKNRYKNKYLNESMNSSLMGMVFDYIDSQEKEISRLKKALGAAADKQIVLTPEEEAFIKVLESVANYPLDKLKDRELYNTLSKRYPEVDITEAVRDWAIHKLEDPLITGKNPRSQINTWARNCVHLGKNLKPKQQPKKNGKYDNIYL